MSVQMNCTAVPVELKHLAAGLPALRSRASYFSSPVASFTFVDPGLGILASAGLWKAALSWLLSIEDASFRFLVVASLALPGTKACDAGVGR
jgi:hypothetical protein